MSAPIERAVPPNAFRDQYTGGVKTDPEFEAALAGAEPMTIRTAPMPQMTPGSAQFGPMVRLK